MHKYVYVKEYISTYSKEYREIAYMLHMCA